MSSELWFSLFILAKLGAIYKKIEISSTKFAKEISASQQTASRRIIELEKLGWISREPHGTGHYLQISKKGQDQLKDVYYVLSKFFEPELKSIEIEGELFTGMEEGGYYVSREGYKKQFLEKLGFKDIYPGTLNLKLTKEEDIKNRKILLDRKDLGIAIKGFKNKDRTYGDVICYKCKVNEKIDGALLAIERTHHEETVIEIIAPVYLRDALNIKDGDNVKIKVFLNTI
ncbi:MAG: CTP-dependent riboflavin kinase [Candidatus Helarchaeota archaeon]|nr:CTP-dependent riboflavin kinase [Candidatus Helarchaeota archaeon]